MGRRILMLQHSPAGGPGRLGGWLTDAGAEVEICRPFDGDPVPTGMDGYGGLISMGGAMGANDDAHVPWLAPTKQLLRTAVADGLPTLGVCLGAQLLAVATGGTVGRGPDGPEVGAHLTGKRDAAESDPLFGALPMTPDVMHCHHDVITVLPPEAVLLMAGTGYPHQAFRVGASGWGVQFHIEADAATVRSWAASQGVTGRLGPELDDAEANMAEVWPAFARRFVELRRQLPLIGAG